jgi:succinoglycan biosynthesis transport protein ExoP
MSEPKITFHPPVPRPDSSVPETLAALNGKRLATTGGPQSRQAGNGGPSQSMTSQLALNALRRWWKISLPIGLLLSAAAAGMVYWSFEPQYEAAAFLEINEAAPYIAFEPKEGGVSKAYFRTQIEIIRSRWILGRTVASAAIKELPEVRKQADKVEYLRKRVNVVSPNDSDVFEIKYTCADPESAALVVNEVTRQYLLTQEEEEGSRYLNILGKLSEEWETHRKSVTTLREQVETIAENLMIEEPNTPQGNEKPVPKNPVSELQSRLVAVQVQRALLSARIKALEEEIQNAEASAAKSKLGPAAAQAKSGTAPPAKKYKRELTPEEIELRDQLVEQDLDNSPDTKPLESQLLTQHIHLDRLEKQLLKGKKDSLYVKALDNIKVGEKTLDELKKQLRPRYEKAVELTLRNNRRVEQLEGPVSDRAVIERRKEELADLRLDVRGLEIAEDKMKAEQKAQTDDFSKKRGRLSQESLSLKFKEDELSAAQGVLDKISERMIAMRTERSAPARIILHNKAEAPQVPVEVLPFSKMSLAGMLAFCLPFALAVAWEVRAHRIGSPDELEQHLHLTVLGEIARLPASRRAGTAPQQEAKRIGSELRIFEESIDSLRTALTLSDGLHDMRILAITSAANHEGKTSVASQLALSLARAAGKATLLIDGDMRSPDVHQVFGVARGPGLAEVLGNECSLTDAIVATHNPNVQLLPAGRLRVSPHKLLGNGAWKSLLAQIPANYAYVIIDTPPVLAASEALVLAKHADAILICVMRDVSRADQVRKASNLLTAAGGCPVGTVLNGVPISRYKYYYGTYPAGPAPSHS